MKVYIQSVDDRLETKNLFERIADHVIANGSELVNPDLETDLEKAAGADVVVARLDTYHDSTWAAIGLARAGNIPIVPFWGASYEYPDECSSKPTKVYGFTKDVHLRNRHLVRDGEEYKVWPSRTVKELAEDLRKLHFAKGWREQRIPRPEQSDVDLTLPLYVIGDARNKENCWAFYDIAGEFRENGVDCIIPPEEIDAGYRAEHFPKRLVIDEEKSSVQICADLASHRSSFVVSRSDEKSLMGARWEEGVGFYHKKPILYLYRYVFPSRNPQEKHEAGKNPGFHYASVFKQNEDLWGIKTHSADTPTQLTDVINEVREKYSPSS